jgi:hypothetical protein
LASQKVSGAARTRASGLVLAAAADGRILDTAENRAAWVARLVTDGAAGEALLARLTPVLGGDRVRAAVAEQVAAGLAAAGVSPDGGRAPAAPTAAARQVAAGLAAAGVAGRERRPTIDDAVREIAARAAGGGL